MIDQGKYDEASEIYGDLVARWEKIEGPSGLSTIYQVMKLAFALHKAGKDKEAELLARRSQLIETQFLGENHPSALDTTALLSRILLNQGRFEEAKTLCKQTLEMRREVLGGAHPDTENSREWLRLIQEKQREEAGMFSITEEDTTFAEEQQSIGLKRLRDSRLEERAMSLRKRRYSI